MIMVADLRTKSTAAPSHHHGATLRIPDPRRLWNP
jgi:hypothetical protein